MKILEFRNLALTKSNECLVNELKNLRNKSLHSRSVDPLVPRMINIITNILKDRGRYDLI